MFLTAVRSRCNYYLNQTSIVTTSYILRRDTIEALPRQTSASTTCVFRNRRDRQTSNCHFVLHILQLYG